MASSSSSPSVVSRYIEAKRYAQQVGHQLRKTESEKVKSKKDKKKKNKKVNRKRERKEKADHDFQRVRAQMLSSKVIDVATLDEIKAIISLRKEEEQNWSVKVKISPLKVSLYRRIKSLARANNITVTG